MSISLDGIVMALLVSALALVTWLIRNALSDIKGLTERMIRLEEWRNNIKEKGDHLYGSEDDRKKREDNGDGFLD